MMVRFYGVIYLPLLSLIIGGITFVEETSSCGSFTNKKQCRKNSDEKCTWVKDDAEEGGWGDGVCIEFVNPNPPQCKSSPIELIPYRPYLDATFTLPVDDETDDDSIFGGVTASSRGGASSDIFNQIEDNIKQADKSKSRALGIHPIGSDDRSEAEISAQRARDMQSLLKQVNSSHSEASASAFEDEKKKRKSRRQRKGKSGKRPKPTTLSNRVSNDAKNYLRFINLVNTSNRVDNKAATVVINEIKEELGDYEIL